MALANELSAFVQSLKLDSLDDETVSEARTLLLDALACTIAGADAAVASIAMAGVSPWRDGSAATIVVHGGRTDPAGAAFVNGAMLRSLDLMDTYVALDVCHPSEIIPVALACAESGGASGAEFLATMVAGLSVHQSLARTIPLHRHGLHHAGHAAWVVPLVAGRVLACSAACAATALTVTAHRLLIPETFARGQLTNFKAMAYPLLAREAIEAVRLAQAGLTGSMTACEDMVALLEERFGMSIARPGIVPSMPVDLSTISLKMYPAQYALQPLIAAAGLVHAAGGPGAAARIERVIVRASRRTVERTADKAKYAPSGAEAADHSLPFCVAVALMDGTVTPSAFASGRWKDRETLSLMERIVAMPIGATTGYEVGPQEMEIRYVDGSAENVPCHYPPDGETPRTIAERKLREASRGRVDADAILEVVMNIENEPDLGRLAKALTKAMQAPTHR